MAELDDYNIVKGIYTITYGLKKIWYTEHVKADNLDSARDKAYIKSLALYETHFGKIPSANLDAYLSHQKRTLVSSATLLRLNQPY